MAAVQKGEAAVNAVRGRAAALVRETGNDRRFSDVNYIIPTFILTRLPVGLVGLLILAIIMAATDTIAGELNSLSTATVIDFYKRWLRPVGDRRALPHRIEDGDRHLGSVRLRASPSGRPSSARSSRS